MKEIRTDKDKMQDLVDIITFRLLTVISVARDVPDPTEYAVEALRQIRRRESDLGLEMPS